MPAKDVLEICAIAAEAIARLEPERWSEWMLFIIESVDEKSQSDTWLEALNENIDLRLQLGEW